MRPAPFLYDVIQIGYGPVSEIMALALAKQGRSVAIFERWQERYSGYNSLIGPKIT